MIISSSNLSDLYNYSRINTARPEITVAKPEDTKTEELNTQSSKASSPLTEYKRPEVLPLSEVTDFAMGAMDTDISLIGKDKELTTLDVDKIVSDMQKDSILQDYQYFVGSMQSDDGMVTRKASIQNNTVNIPNFDL